MMQDVILHGDAASVLKTLESESVQCIVTSPPYFGLRDYGAAGQIGLETTPDAYVQALVAVFREVRRVLRQDGTLWLNLGDSYNGSGKGGNPDGSAWGEFCGSHGRQTAAKGNGNRRGTVPTMNGKNLLGMPWRVAFALQDDGWILRSDIIWSKGNPMPESVRDRPTKAHEYVFLFSKSERYFYDIEAIKEPSADPFDNRKARGHAGLKRLPTDIVNGCRPGSMVYPTRNKRSVWNVNTQPFPEAHFAVMPQNLVEPCVLAGTSERACEHCGAPWERVTKEERWNDRDERRGNARGWAKIPERDRETDKQRIHNTNGQTSGVAVQTIGWRPTCRCNNTGESRCVVLDPFAGAGTVPVVAALHGRHYLGIELNASYIEMAERRIAEALRPKRAKITKLPKRPPAAAQASLWEVTA